MDAVIIDHIVKRYDKGAVVALNDVSFSVREGELFGLIGADGAGKTSLFRILTTLLLADAGTARVCGFDVVKEYKAIRGIVGYMPGRFSLYQDLSVKENLDFFATLFGTSVQENYDLIKDIYVQLEPFKTRRAGKLSGGMKQKLALCCALIHRPKIMFLDEPTTGVDPVSRKEFWEMLARLKQQGITIMVSTPYMDEATRCERIALIQSGHILSIATPEEITRAYPSPLYAVSTSNMAALRKDLAQLTHDSDQILTSTSDKIVNGTTDQAVNVTSALAFGDTMHVTFMPANTDAAAGLRALLSSKGHRGPGNTHRTNHRRLLHSINAALMEPVITTKGLTKRYGDFIAANDITFDVMPGEIFGFLGANGAGKTTAMRMLCGLSEPSSGEARVAGYDVRTETDRVKQNIGT